MVSEPPWVNQSSGVAARNGTTSHTIPFGFTSTPGGLLVVVVFGAVTHTVDGWTEQLSPVATGELSVFTKVSAGESSITVVHNGADYPACWAAYELPTGSTWTAGTGSSDATTDTFPALSGLPGTEQVVFGARGRATNSTNATAASSSWVDPWVEDADLFVAHNGATNGAYLTAGHQINVTATSSTPSVSSAYTGADFAGEREHVVFAVDVPEGDAAPVNAASAAAVAAGRGSVPVVSAGRTSAAVLSARYMSTSEVT